MDISEGQEKLMSFMRNGEMLKFAASCTSLKLLDKNYKLVVLHDIRSTLQEQEQDSFRKIIRVLTHEIMNSVTPILSLSQAMSESLKTDENKFRPLGELSPQESEDLIEGYQAIEIRSRALMRFVNDFKTLNKLPPPKHKLIEVSEMLKALVTLQKSTFEGKGIELVVSISPRVKTINADKDQIEQVLINLIKNAIDATESITNPIIKIDVFLKDKATCFSVTDNGIGIPFDRFDQVFVPFFSTKHDGSGIGLSLSQEIMRLHGGSITVKSEEGKGATFTISLPFYRF
jgi:signal transduction histidine kinase